MNILVNVIGPEITLKQSVTLDLVSPTVRDVMRNLLNRDKDSWGRVVKDDVSLADGCVALVNGRNIMSLEGFETRIHEGDEITFTVLVAGG